MAKIIDYCGDIIKVKRCDWGQWVVVTSEWHDTEGQEEGIPIYLSTDEARRLAKFLTKAADKVDARDV